LKEDVLRQIYHRLPPSLRQRLMPVADRVVRKFDRSFAERDRWVRDEYMAYGMRMREEIFLSIARFAHINRPIEGYYFEFGCHEANTMRMAWRHFRHLFDWTFVAFDSFEGLPEPSPEDKSAIFTAGNLATDEAAFVDLCRSAGMPADRLITVKGFYDQSLTPALRDRLLPAKAAAIYVDCDLYASTVSVLNFVVPFLQEGTVIVFDDWNCYRANPNRGERLAWKEFREAHPELRFEPFVSTNEAASFIHVIDG
jgi:hypothetical protein